MYVGVNTGVYSCLGLLVGVSCVCASVPIVLHACLCVLVVVYIYGVHILVYMQKCKVLTEVIGQSQQLLLRCHLLHCLRQASHCPGAH